MEKQKECTGGLDPLKLAKRIAKIAKDEEIYNFLVDHTGCGPLDGCCYIFTKACRHLLGIGETCVIIGKRLDVTPTPKYKGIRGIPHHFLLRIDKNTYLDADGISKRETLVKRWRKKENIEISSIKTIKTFIEEEKIARKMGTIINQHLVCSLYTIIKKSTIK
jgi:hypothetical protein